MRFADLLSKSTHPERSDAHKNWAQELCVLATTLYPEDDMVRRYASATQINAGKQTSLWLWTHQNVKLQMKLYSATSATATAFYSRAEFAELTSTPEQAHSASASKAHKASAKPHKSTVPESNRLIVSSRAHVLAQLPSRIRVGVDRSLNVVEQQVRDLHLHDLYLRHVVQQQRVVSRGLQGQSSASEQTIIEILDHLDV